MATATKNRKRGGLISHTPETPKTVYEAPATPAQRELMTELILKAAERPMDRIVQRRDIKGSDGRFYGIGGFPTGVHSTGETSEWFYIFENREGCTYGTRATTEQELIARHQNWQGRQTEEFRKALDEMSDERLAEQANYWLNR